ncbi:MAG: LacI family DNA-binding transcriptional regulator [Candidatus Omnitrophota bacterium]|jgi:DNA-binding LacI/PurR family transcriptional regulator
MSVKSLEELAQKLNISRRTISRVLKNDKNVAEETRERILKHLDKEKYFPNIHAASLASKKINVIGLVFPNDTFINTDFFAIDTIKGVARAANENNYQLMIFTQTKFDGDQCLQMYKSKLVGGLILVAISRDDTEKLEELRKQQVPVALLFAYSERADSFGCDNRKGGYVATKHLIDTGRKRIAFIHGHENWFDAEERFKGYKQALEEAGLQFRPEYVERGYFRYEDAEIVAKKFLLLDSPPDGIFAANDRMAIGAIKAIKGAGKRVPEDVAIVGFDNIPICELFDPPITTVDQPVVDIAYEAGSDLLNSINSPHRKSYTRFFDPKLIIRKSA